MGKHNARDKLEIVAKEKDTRLFQGIIAFISLTIPPHQFKKVKEVLISNGAQVVSTDGNSVNCHICKDAKEGSADMEENSRNNYGVDCVLACVEKKHSLPTGNSPIVVMNYLMKDMIMCISGLAPDAKYAVTFTIMAMGGVLTRDFTSEATYLIGADTSSIKYKAAIENGIPTLRPEWVTHSFQEKKLLPIEKYYIPPFQNLLISSSGIRDKERLRKIIEENGGKYEKDLRRDCTHLIADVAKGQKWLAAKKWNQCVVKEEWLTDCLAHNGRVNENLFRLSDDTENKNTNFIDSEFSRVTASSVENDERVTSAASSQISHPSQGKLAEISPGVSLLETQGNLAETEIQVEHHDEIPISYEPYEAGDLFKNLWIQPRGPWNDFELAHLRRLVESGQGNFLEESDSTDGYIPKWINYVIVPHGTKPPPEDVDQPAPLVVSKQWLERSIELKRLIDPTSSPLFVPMGAQPPFPSMKGLKISVSGFSETEERNNIKNLVEISGAIYTENFARSNTHLICKAPEGAKYNKAITFDTYVVSIEWLYEVVKVGHAVDESKFSLRPSGKPGKRSGKPGNNQYSNDTEETIQASMAPVPTKAPILAGVTVLLKMKVPDMDRYSQMISNLGGQYCYAPDPSVTHVIAENSSRVQLGNDKNVISVSSMWIDQCFKLGKRLLETDFPPKMNPKMALAVTGSSLSPNPGRTSGSSKGKTPPAKKPAESYTVGKRVSTDKKINDLMTPKFSKEDLPLRERVEKRLGNKNSPRKVEVIDSTPVQVENVKKSPVQVESVKKTSPKKSEVKRKMEPKTEKLESPPKKQKEIKVESPPQIQVEPDFQVENQVESSRTEDEPSFNVVLQSEPLTDTSAMSRDTDTSNDKSDVQLVIQVENQVENQEEEEGSSTIRPST
eukprot:TRINITY_DN3032_c0_g2_i1.p1 TRINITY_DN3032_c0_g2~~TRINITY_DN3032_c0_g2_i1.p1  ORF type:complete len:899 (-),score=305.77 TRINITY_DN3032_c0_g2_i1:895-3591(-)